ncbi:peptidylprolyl isomerase [Cecembia rubra]|uniref:Peptidyl-prolyl cis-trans isomerase n=1 Tax=Cecembia rubra TaxID=1485585 RepID=A0A2P8EEQ7_9BACT|nr:peptidylprolyl isomerase [Cecembia rubra]PSL07947.1 peptidyl-prolyl cis-trans isomerase B (cyclophilin B) [Cecembia rubra]
MKKYLACIIFIFGFIFLGYGQSKIPVGHINTPKGEVFIQLFDETPQHKQSFIDLAKSGYWDSLTFNRVIPNFVAQGGCPDTEEGFNDPEYLLNPEFHPSLTHVYGAVGAGRDDNPAKLSARCQFYIVQNKSGLHRLDGNYTVFGQVIKGMEVIDSIVSVERNPSDTPIEAIPINVSIIYLDQEAINYLIQSNK